jgi:hypothetical protein
MSKVTQSWQARLLSAAMALALVFASSIGAYAHALAHSYSGHAHAASHQDSGATPVADGMEHNGEPHKAPATNHAGCYDTICHGGYAIVGQVSLVPYRPKSTPAIPLTRADAGVQPQSLDRPPRPPVLA